MTRFALAMAVSMLSLQAFTASAQPEFQMPRILQLRYDEDWRGLCDPAHRRQWLDRLKCIKLDERTTLTLGGELREYFEASQNPEYGLNRQTDVALLHRALLHGDVRVQDSARLFLQLGGLYRTGRDDQPGATDIDRFDIMQGFIDLSAPFDGGRMTLRGGRQEMSFGSARLISVRDGANARRAFDGGRLFWQGAGYRADMLYTRPVDILPGVFDDLTSPSQALWGFYGTGPVPRAGALKADLYYLGFQNFDAAFASGNGVENRQTLGLRLFGVAGGWDWDIEAAYQFGTFAERAISAWTVASDVGFTVTHWPLRPRLGLKADIASGDQSGGNGPLGTFNALFPKLPYFSAANLITPANIMDLRPSLKIQPFDALALEFGWNGLWRQTTADAIYMPPLSAIPGTAGQGGAFVGQQLLVGFEWQPTANLFLAGQYVHFFVSDTLRQLGGADVDYVFVSVAFKF